MPAILRPDEHMQVVTYTGTGAGQTLYCGFKPDLVWIKSRSATTSHKLTDSVRGITKGLISNNTGAETTDTNGVTAFTDTGFTIGSDSNYNTNGATYVAWCWKAGQGTNITNTNGTITSTVSVNASAGFSIVSYTGTAANATVGHGLGVAPSFIVAKRRVTGGYNWVAWHSAFTGTQFIKLNLTDDYAGSATVWNSTTPTSTVFSLGSDTTINPSGEACIAYCWTPIAGYSAFGSYTGNGSADGPFVYLGFRPKYVLIKRINNISNWTIRDTSRSPINVTTTDLWANLADAESSAGPAIDLLSNGFKLRDAGGQATNATSSTYIYMAFAENPFRNALAR